MQPGRGDDGQSRRRYEAASKGPLRKVEVEVTYLELTAPDQLRHVQPPADGGPVVAEVASTPETSRSLYRGVGDEWHWHDRLDWKDEDWAAWLADAAVRTWVARHAGETAGYYQLAFEDTPVEIAYFGLLSRYFGRGWGGWLLTRAVQDAWAAGAERVWLHTCTLDHPAALSNYLRRGFRVFDRHMQVRRIRGGRCGGVGGG